MRKRIPFLRPHAKNCSAIRPALELLEDRLAPAAVTIDTVALTISGADMSPNTFYGALFTASAVGGKAQFRIAGNLNVPAGDVITATGFRPVSLLVAGDVNIGQDAIFNFLANGFQPGSGGGFGGGAGSFGGLRGVGGAGGGGGAGGQGYGPFNSPTGGQSGSDGQPGINGLPGAHGLAGSFGSARPSPPRHPADVELLTP